MDPTDPNYDRAAPFYDVLAHAFSLGAIRRAKLAEVRLIAPEERVLFLGAGTGEEAVRAAQRRAIVTCIDISAAMLGRLRRRLEERGIEAELIVGDALAHDRFAAYDIVAGNFFFNAFSPQRMPPFLDHAVRLIRPGGRLMIADLAPPAGSFPAQLFNRFYARFGMIPFWLAGLVAWHPTYDYSAQFPRLGLVCEVVEDFRLFRHGPVMFRMTVARKQTTD